MSEIFKKLNLKHEREIAVIDAPDSFEPELKKLNGIKIHRRPAKGVTFAIAFVHKRARLDELSELLAKSLEGDSILWFAYPKKTSKRYTCEFNRDTGWSKIMGLGFRPVRMVAIDEDWSAFRVRRAEYVKSRPAVR